MNSSPIHNSYVVRMVHMFRQPTQVIFYLDPSHRLVWVQVQKMHLPLARNSRATALCFALRASSELSSRYWLERTSNMRMASFIENSRLKLSSSHLAHTHADKMKSRLAFVGTYVHTSLLCLICWSLREHKVTEFVHCMQCTYVSHIAIYLIEVVTVSTSTKHCFAI